MAVLTLTINDQQVTAAEGETILSAARAAGVHIPTLCFLDGVSAAAACRLCLVEINGSPKLQASCVTRAAENMVVQTETPKLVEYRRMILELLLAERNHVCSVCVANGHCELQDQAAAAGVDHVRYEYQYPLLTVDVSHERFGVDHNRCILCTRCVRFMDDIHHAPVLNVSERGDRAYIGKAPDADLTQPWAANVVDLCPVGALLSKDFLNKARAWELDRTASVCTGCSQGCNVTLELRDMQVVRIRPRGNADVNRFFMCDHGRLDYRWMNRPDRLEVPMSGGEAVDWEIAVAAAASVLEGKRAYVVANASLSNEALYLLKRLVAITGGSGSFRVEQGTEAPLPGVPDLSLRADRAANGAGAELLGFSRNQNPLAGLKSGDVLILADEDLEGLAADAVAKADAVIVIGTAMPKGVVAAAVVLPIANVAEEEGTLTNLRGRVQRYLQAKAAPGMARPAWFVLSDLLNAVGEKTDFLAASAVFDALAKAEKPFAGMSYDALALSGIETAGMRVGAGA